MSDLSQLPFFVVFNSEDKLAAVYEEEHACFARKLRGVRYKHAAELYTGEITKEQ